MAAPARKRKARRKAGKVIKLRKQPKPERKAPTGTITGPCMDKGWQTPPELVECVRTYFGGEIPFDAATTRKNPCQARTFCTTQGLTKPWPKKVWVNPPYGRDLRVWLPKMAHESEGSRATRSEIISLLPCSRWEQYYFQYMLTRANLVCLIRKRVKFVRPSTGERVAGNPYANMFLAFNGRETKFRRSFGHLGPIFRIECLLGPAPEELPTP